MLRVVVFSVAHQVVNNFHRLEPIRHLIELDQPIRTVLRLINLFREYGHTRLELLRRYLHVAAKAVHNLVNIIVRKIRNRIRAATISVVLRHRRRDTLQAEFAMLVATFYPIAYALAQADVSGWAGWQQVGAVRFRWVLVRTDLVYFCISGFGYVDFAEGFVVESLWGR